MADAKPAGLRRRIQMVMWWFLPAILVGGLVWPHLGYLVAAMMVGFLVLALFRGRFWCGWACPRGSFLEIVLPPVSRKRPIPRVMTTPGFRWTVFAVLMAFMSFRIWSAVHAADIVAAVGFVFVTMCWVTTLIALPLAVAWAPRTWCAVCPMGTLQGLLGGKRKLIAVSPACVECGLCRKACPIGTYPGAYKALGSVPSEHCLKCRACVAVCPKQALS